MRSSTAFARTALVFSAVLSLSVFGTGCKRGGGTGGGADSFPLVPVSRGHDSLVGTLIWPSVEGSLKDVGAVAKKLGLPFSADDVKASMLAQAPLKEAVGQIDLAKPLALVFLSDATVSADAGAASKPRLSGVAAFAPRAGAPTTVEGWAKLMGTIAERRQDAVAIRVAPDAGASGLPEQPFYLLMRDGNVLIADAWTSLEQGGALALAARKNDIKKPTVSLRPEGLARQQGTTLAAALEKARGEFKKNLVLTGEKPPSPMVTSMLDGMLDLAFGWVQSTEALEISVALDDVHGLALTLGLRPTSGSALAQGIAASKPYVAEPALLGGDAPVVFVASGESPWLKEFLAVARKALDTLPAEEGKRAELRRWVDSLTEAWTGAGSVAMRAKDGLSYDLVYAIDPAHSSSLVEAFTKSVGPSPLGDLGSVDPMLAGMTFVLEKEGDAFFGHIVGAKKKGAKAKSASPDAEAAMGFLTNLEFRTVVAGPRLVATVGPGSKARFEALLAAVKAGTPAAPNPELAATLEATKGALAIEAIDLAGLFRGAAALASQPGLGGGTANAQQASALAAMLGDAHLSLFMDMRGGDALSFTLHVPMETASSGAMLAMRFMSGGANLAAPPSAAPVPARKPRHH